jgi:hypothetical protein
MTPAQDRSSDGAGYELVQLASGPWSVRSLAEGETFHPVIGPAAEAEALYLRQLHLPDRMRAHAGEFVIWDVGLGAAANVLTVLAATRDLPCPLRILSFDHTLDPLRFGVSHREQLTYFASYAPVVNMLIERGEVQFANDRQPVCWQAHVADFPSLIRQAGADALPKPHAIMYDAFSPARNPDMWTLPHFTRLHRLLDAARSCALPTYSRSTLLRVTLLVAGFYVGVGHATGEKEETTVAANNAALIESPLDRRWLARARRSTSAEPLHEPRYRQARLSPEILDRLERHPQFAG